jgi:hypothetical protein
MEKNPWMTRTAYARQQDYDLIVDFEASKTRTVMWHKFVMIEEIIDAGQHDWVWWIDFDTLITNTSIKLTDIIAESLAETPNPDEIDFILTKDWYVAFPMDTRDKQLTGFCPAFNSTLAPCSSVPIPAPRNSSTACGAMVIVNPGSVSKTACVT